MSVTRQLPCSPIVDGKPIMYEFTGVDIGPMFVHKGAPDIYSEGMRGNWTITHTQSGHSVRTRIRSSDRAARAAKQLAKLPCWDFCDPKVSKEVTKDYMSIIRSILEAA